MTAAAQNNPADYAKSHWRQFENSEDHAERVERAELTAGWYFAEATKRQLEAHRRAMADLRGLVAPCNDRARAAAQAAWHRSTQEARDLYERTCDEIMRDGEMSEALTHEWDALCAREAARAVAPDEQPDCPTPVQVKTALHWSRDEILIARAKLEDDVSRLIEAFADGRYSEISQAAATIKKTSGQIGGLALSLVTACVEQMNRKPRP